MKCKYRLPSQALVDDYQCSHEVFEVSGVAPSQEGFCIFHLPKIPQSGENEAQVREKLKAFQEGIDKIFKETSAAEIDFRGFNFPRFKFDEDYIFPVDFSYCVFSDDTEFMGISFEESVLFNGTEFDGNINFHYTKFKGYAGFQKARFSKNVDFHRALFHSSVSFSGAQFKTASFYEVTVGERFGDDINYEELPRPYASFADVMFVESILFDDTYFEGEAYFNGSTFQGEAHFVADKGDVFGDYCDFRKVILTKDSNLTFFRANLSRTSFHDTNLEHIIFRDVKWASATTKWQKLIRGSSYILWDEVRPLQGMRDWHDDAKTTENYRQLVTNYEGKRDYNAAEYFHVGEMEMQRKEVGERAFQYVIEQLDSLFPVTVEGKSIQKLIGRVGFSIARKWGWMRHYLNAYGIYWFSRACN